MKPKTKQSEKEKCYNDALSKWSGGKINQTNDQDHDGCLLNADSVLSFLNMLRSLFYVSVREKQYKVIKEPTLTSI